MDFIFNLGKTLISTLFTNKSDQDNALLNMLKLKEEGGLTEVENMFKIMVEDAKSSDKWTSRARPSFMYAMYVLILFSIPMGLLCIFCPSAASAFETGVKGWFNAIPDMLWLTFLGCFGIYGSGRTLEKINLYKTIANVIKK